MSKLLALATCLLCCGSAGAQTAHVQMEPASVLGPAPLARKFLASLESHSDAIGSGLRWPRAKRRGSEYTARDAGI
jgi:hypothetical protein